MHMDDSSGASEIAHVLFVDMVGYSLQPIDRQTASLSLLQEIVRQTAEFQRARDNNELVSLPTGDGMGLVFLRDPLSPVRCALQIATSLQNHPELRVRMGMHSGPVQRHADIREEVNIVGGGINTAQRVMDCGDAGHILLSRNVAEVLEQFSDWSDCLQDLGIHAVKHGTKVHLYNLIKLPLGNPEIPRKLISEAGAEAARATLPVGSKGELPLPLPKEFYRRAGLFAGVFLIACVLAFGFEQWVDRGIASGESGVTSAAMAFSGLYWVIFAAPENPTPQYTVMAEIDLDRDLGSVGLYDLCRQRKMMTVLIRRIAAAMPSAIVIDKFYLQTECPGDTNSALAAAMSEISAKVPLIVGRRVLKGTSYLQPAFLVGIPDLKEAIVNVDPDTRKVPLEWQLFPTKSDMDRNTRLKWYPTLALKAAEVYEKDRLTERHPRLAKLLNSHGQHPYISFLEIQQFERLTVGQILCGREVQPGEDATACAGSPRDLADLSGKIVLIGEIARDEDKHTTVVGRINGLDLQANFIEALLDDRFYEGVPALDYVFGFLFLAGLEVILTFFRDSWIKMLAAIGLLVLAMLLLLHIVISNLHWYVNPLPFIALALLVRALAANLPSSLRKFSAREA
jgi:class 3 adenylate cyclase/CHASE2 domain-containing sensor protein